MSFHLPSVRAITLEAGKTFRRFPLSLISAFICTAIGLYLIDGPKDFLDFPQLAMAVALGIPLFLAIDLALEEQPLQSGVLVRVAGILFIVIYFFIAREDDTLNFLVRYFQLSLVCHLAVAIAAFRTIPDIDAFWRFNKSLFLRFCLSALYAFVFWAGLSIALGVTDFLFSLHNSGKAIPRLWVVATGVLMTWVFLAGVPDLKENASAEKTYPKGLKIFTQFMLVPLVVLYLLILYAYMGKIVVSREWPDGTVAWLITALGTFGTWTLLLLYPATKDKDSGWIPRFSKIFYSGVIPLMFMLLISVAKRIEQYGLTEKRYILIVLAIWLLGLSIYFLVSKVQNIRWIPTSLLFLAIITSFGPWGAYSVSLRSQLSRIEETMLKTGILVNGRAQKLSQELSFEDRKRLSGIFDYILECHGEGPLKKWFPDYDFSRKVEETYRGGILGRKYWRGSANLMESIGQEYVNSHERETDRKWAAFYSKNVHSSLTKVEGYDYVIDFYHATNTKIEFEIDGRKYLFESSKAVAYEGLKDGKRISMTDFTPMYEKLQKLEFDKRKDLEIDMMSAEFESEDLKGKFVFKELTGNATNEKIEFTGGHGHLLLKKR